MFSLRFANMLSTIVDAELKTKPFSYRYVQVVRQVIKQKSIGILYKVV